jgi:hypothetical protein
MITRVNYGDRPAGCIAIAAVRETATRFGKGKETAAWFIKNRTYVDDATGGASSMEAARRVSQDMEDILENGGFCFKETVMSGDLLGEGGELRKVLGLRWDTQRDKICVDIMLPYRYLTCYRWVSSLTAKIPAQEHWEPDHKIKERTLL